MKEISTILFDIGGVCLTNGWDEISRKEAAGEFSIDYKEMEERHELIFKDFEKGEISLDAYLNEVVYFRKRNFTKKDFINFMYSCSHAYDSTFKILEKLSENKKYRLATINNESLELNSYRIKTFQLYNYFNCFFSSCYLGVRKPEEEIFNVALNVLHKTAEECLYIDDRKENFDSAISIGLNSIFIKNPAELAEELEKYKIDLN